MKIEDIINNLNGHLTHQRFIQYISIKGHFVIHKLLEPHPTFKAYKKYSVTLWYLQDNKKYPVLHIQETAKAISSDSTLQDLVESKLCYHIFNWMLTPSYQKIIRGKYDGKDINE